MTISFFVANFPFGLLYLTEFMVLDTPRLAYITKRMISVFTFLNIANGTVHFIICISMSSQYREVAKQLLRMGRVKNSIQDSGASAGHAFNVNSVRYE
ncbi:hypothetical protein CAEBREN_10635 [Caenorhabditis brenneri]|uniref:G-protein coupled receptors family 1 profile domain-containing protein n=1 Tax=Caenorhabditis brenneri TaxID=135651 RepID=G0P667_CAEBE|nr:hypothetical protein CAEBREN_10635 [Caenorhabditis brenneri]